LVAACRIVVRATSPMSDNCAARRFHVAASNPYLAASTTRLFTPNKSRWIGNQFVQQRVPELSPPRSRLHRRTHNYSICALCFPMGRNIEQGCVIVGPYRAGGKQEAQHDWHRAPSSDARKNPGAVAHRSAFLFHIFRFGHPLRSIRPGLVRRISESWRETLEGRHRRARFRFARFAPDCNNTTSQVTGQFERNCCGSQASRFAMLKRHWHLSAAYSARTVG